MSIQAGKTYTKVTIQEGAINIEFPDAVIGAIKPGTIKGIRQRNINIKWGLSMTDLIEPGVIPPLSSLMLDKNYKHPIDSTPLTSLTDLYIHDSNRSLGPDSGDFWLWRTDRPFTKEEFEDSDIECTGRASTSSNFSFLSEDPIYIIYVRKPVSF